MFIAYVILGIFHSDKCFDKGESSWWSWVGHMESTPLLFLVFFPSPSHLFVGLAYEDKDIVFLNSL